MVVFFISIVGYAIMCVGPSLTCTQIPIGALSTIVLAGGAELMYEIGGILKLYRLKNKDEDNGKDF